MNFDWKIVKKRVISMFVAREIAKCKKNPEYFLETYCKILTELDGPQPFKLYDFQRHKCIRTFLKHKRVVIGKGRQTGVSTIISGYVLWCMIFRDYFSAIIISKDKEAAQGVIKKIQMMLEYMPEWLHPKQTVDNKQSIELANGSYVQAFASSTESGRSFSAKLLVFDECAFIRESASIWRAAQPTLSKTQGSFIACSTPNGRSGFFADKYFGAPENGFCAEKIMWHEMPERDEEWKENQIRDIGEKNFAQEFAVDFQQSGGTVVDPNDIEWVENECIKDPVIMINVMDKKGHTLNKEKEMWIWEEPIAGEKYIIVGDVARGDGDDFSAFSVFKLPKSLQRGGTIYQVAEFKGKIKTDVYGELLSIVGHQYNGAIMIVENNSMGVAVLNELVRRDYPNLYYTDKAAKQVSMFENLNIQTVHSVPGFTTTVANRQKLIPNSLEKAIRQKTLIMRSKRFINECWSWLWIDGKAIHDDGCNDDLMMSTAIFTHLYETSLEEQNVNEEKFTSITNVILDNREQKIKEMEILQNRLRLKESKNPWIFQYQQSQLGSRVDDDCTWDLRELVDKK